MPHVPDNALMDRSNQSLPRQGIAFLGSTASLRLKNTHAAMAAATIFLKNAFCGAGSGLPPHPSARRTNIAISAKPNALRRMQATPLRTELVAPRIAAPFRIPSRSP